MLEERDEVNPWTRLHALLHGGLLREGRGGATYTAASQSPISSAGAICDGVAHRNCRIKMYICCKVGHHGLVQLLFLTGGTPFSFVSEHTR